MCSKIPIWIAEERLKSEKMGHWLWQCRGQSVMVMVMVLIAGLWSFRMWKGMNFTFKNSRLVWILIRTLQVPYLSECQINLYLRGKSKEQRWQWDGFRFEWRSVTASVWDWWWMEAMGKVPRYYQVSQRHTEKHFQKSCYCCCFPLLYFNIYYYSTEGQDFGVEVDGRRWLCEGQGRERR